MAKFIPFVQRVKLGNNRISEDLLDMLAKEIINVQRQLESKNKNVILRVLSLHLMV